MFETEITQVLNNLFRKETKKIKSTNLFVRIRVLLKSKTVKNSQGSKDLISSILKSYKKERAFLKKFLQKSQTGSLKTGKDIEEIFKPNEN